MEIFLMGLILFIFLLELKMKKTVFTEIFWIMFPFAAIALINNFIAVRFGYYKLKEDNIVIICIGLICFYIGVILNRMIKGQKTFVKTNIQEHFTKKPALNYQIIYFYVMAVLLVRYGKIIFTIKNYGFAGLIENDFYRLNLYGLLAHLHLSIYPLTVILFYKGVKEKNMKYKIITLFVVLSCFLTFIKYHVITLLLMILFYFGFKEKDTFKKSIMIVGAFIVSFFVLNYYIDFIFNSWGNNTVEFYFKHLWTYIAGGSINSNLLMEQTILYDKADLLISIFFAFPNMFLQKIAGEKILPENILLTEEVYYKISDSGAVSNVTSTLGYIYGDGKLFAFALCLIIWGFISSKLYEKKNKNEMYCVIASCYFAFCTLSFFGFYLGMSTLYEIILYCIILLSIVRKSKLKKIKFMWS